MVHIVFDNLSLAGVVDVFTNKLMDGLITTDGIFKTCGVDAMIVAWAPRRSDRSQAKPCCKQEAELCYQRSQSEQLSTQSVAVEPKLCRGAGERGVTGKDILGGWLRL